MTPLPILLARLEIGQSVPANMPADFTPEQIKGGFYEFRVGGDTRRLERQPNGRWKRVR